MADTVRVEFLMPRKEWEAAIAVARKQGNRSLASLIRELLAAAIAKGRAIATPPHPQL